MTFSVTLTANSLSELRSLLDKFEGTSVVEPSVEKPAARKGRLAKETKEETPPPVEEAKSETPALTYNDVKDATVALASQDADKVRSILGEFGVQKATALKETQWADYIAKIKSGLEKQDLA